MLVLLPPYLDAHLFFHRFQQMNIGQAYRSILWAAFFVLGVHHYWISICSEEWSVCILALPAKMLHTLASKFTLFKKCSMQSTLHLSRKKTQRDCSMQRLVSFSLVGCLPLRVLHSKKDDLKGMILFHKIEFKWFYIFFLRYPPEMMSN